MLTTYTRKEVNDMIQEALHAKTERGFIYGYLCAELGHNWPDIYFKDKTRLYIAIEHAKSVYKNFYEFGASCVLLAKAADDLTAVLQRENTDEES